MKRIILLAFVVFLFGASEAFGQQAGRPRQVATKPVGACNERDFIQALDTDIASLCQNATWKDLYSGAAPGDVVGPASATDNAFARYNLTTGKLIQGSLVTGDDNGSVNIPAGQAYKINNVALGPTDVGAQPVDADLTTIAGLAATTDNFMVAVSSAWASRTVAQVKATLVLDQVANTSDANKPVSSAQQTALDLKANLAGPTFTGTVTIPTPFTLGAVSVLPTGTELNFVDGVTSAIQSQLDAKQNTITFGTGVQTALGVNVGSAGAPVVNGGALGSPSSVGTIPAFTLGGTISGGGSEINNVIIGTSNPLAGFFSSVNTTGGLGVGIATPAAGLAVKGNPGTPAADAGATAAGINLAGGATGQAVIDLFSTNTLKWEFGINNDSSTVVSGKTKSVSDFFWYNGSYRALMGVTGNLYLAGSITATLYATATKCTDSAGAAACAAAPGGAVVIDAAATSVVVSTTAVTANSQIIPVFDSSLGTLLSVTCNTTIALPAITARSVGSSFTITIAVAPITNPACFTFTIIN